MGIPPSEERLKEAVKSFITGSSSGSLSSFRPVIWFLFLQLMRPSAKMDLEVKASGRSKAHCGLE